MLTYLRNILRWLIGFFLFHRIQFKATWSASQPRWWLLYLFDYGACVILLAGPVEPISTYAQRHRRGDAWGFLLRLIEKVDPGHGLKSGPALWGSQEPPKWVRIAVPTLWFLGLIGWVGYGS